MKKFFSSFIFKLIVGIIIGAIIGLICRWNSEDVLLVNVPQFAISFISIIPNQLSVNVMQVVACIHRLLGQFVSFCVPLIVLGFIMPSITKIGDNAGKFLGIALLLAYASSVLAATMSAIAGYALVPMLNIIKPEDAGMLPEAIFKLDIPQIMPVITALFLSISIGLTVVWTKSNTWKTLLAEFQNIILDLVQKFVIPILPIYICTTFINLGFDGTLEQFPIFIIAIIIVIVGHFVWMTLLYVIAGIYSKKNPFEVFKHYGPAYLTAVGTMSSAATLSVALSCARKSKVLRQDVVNFGIPLFANIHLCGSVLTETFFVFIIHKILIGTLPSIPTTILFILLLGIFAVGAPGVPGGTVVASLGIVEGVMFLGQSPEIISSATGMLLAIFALQDSFGTACNVTGDGALTLILSGYADKNNNIMKKSIKKKNKR